MHPTPTRGKETPEAYLATDRAEVESHKRKRGHSRLRLATEGAQVSEQTMYSQARH